MPAVIHSWLGIFVGPLVLIFLGFILFALIKELLRLSQQDNEVPAFESNWGGMGRGLGGWSVNRMMVFSLLTLLVLLMFGSIAYNLTSVTAGEKARKEDSQEQEKQGEQKQPDQKQPAASSPSGAASPAQSNPASPPPSPAANPAGNKGEGAPK